MDAGIFAEYDSCRSMPAQDVDVGGPGLATERQGRCMEPVRSDACDLGIGVGDQPLQTLAVGHLVDPQMRKPLGRVNLANRSAIGLRDRQTGLAQVGSVPKGIQKEIAHHRVSRGVGRH
jgi:hypothetical protein